MAFNISERVEPSETELDIYIGLEHLDSGCIHIRRSGIPSDVKGIKLRVYPGDIIFGKRRAYQRKAGLVDFDGICSAHAMVVRVNPKVILPELFPFFMHSDLFMHRAVDISEGSLSPTIKWKIIAEEEFKLPPLVEQKRLAELLWSVDEVIEMELELLLKLKKFEKVKMNELLNGKHLSVCNNKIPIGWIEKKISQLGTVSTSSVDKKIKKGEKNINLINYMDIYTSKDKKITNSIKFMQVSANNNQLIKNQVKRGDVLFTPSSETSDDIGYSAVIYEEMPETLYSYHLVRLKFNEKDNLDLNYKRFIFNNPRIMRYFSIRSKGVTRMTLSLDDFNETKILIPPKDEQRRISKILSQIIKEKIVVNRQIINSKEIQKQIINQIFGGKS
jgi:restriction endonuclease S subunit